jgi:hypothetical protein
MKINKPLSLLGSTFLAVSMFTGCATATLQTKAKVTRSIFLNPVKKEQRTIYLTVKNTSGQDVDLYPKLKEKLVKKGYRIIDDPEKAKYVLIVNILFADNLKEANALRGSSYGGSFGAAAGSGNGGKGVLVGAIAGALIGGVLGKVTEDEIYRMVVDVDIREKINQTVATTTGRTEGQPTIANTSRAGFMNEFAGRIKSNDSTGELNDGITDSTAQSYKTNFIEKKTRIYAEAVKMKLTLNEALPILEEKISKSIAGIF